MYEKEKNLARPAGFPQREEKIYKSTKEHHDRRAVRRRASPIGRDLTKSRMPTRVIPIFSRRMPPPLSSPSPPARLSFDRSNVRDTRLLRPAVSSRRARVRREYRLSFRSAGSRAARFPRAILFLLRLGANGRERASIASLSSSRSSSAIPSPVVRRDAIDGVATLRIHRYTSSDVENSTGLYNPIVIRLTSSDSRFYIFFFCF